MRGSPAQVSARPLGAGEWAAAHLCSRCCRLGLAPLRDPALS